MAIVTVDELAPYLGGLTLTPEQEGIAETIIIPGIQEELELFLNRPLEPVQVRESTYVDYEGKVTLSVSPVWRILSAQYSDGVVVPTTVYYPPVTSQDPSVQRRVDLSAVGMGALPYRLPVSALGLSMASYGFGYGYLNQTYLIVEYIGGYLGYTDNALKMNVLRVVARECERMFDDTASVRQGQLEAAGESDKREKGWTEDELNRLRRLKRRVIV